jgi:hypothetical protein
MRVTTIRVQTEPKRLDRSVRHAEKRAHWARMLRVRGLIRPALGAYATAHAARGEKRLLNWQNQALLPSSGKPLGEFRLFIYHCIPMTSDEPRYEGHRHCP